MSDLAFQYFAIRPVHPVRRLHMFLESWGAIADIGGLQFQATLSYRANRFAEDAWEFMGPLWSLFPDEYAKLKAVRWDRREQKASRKVFSLLRLIDASLDKSLLNESFVIDGSRLNRTGSSSCMCSECPEVLTTLCGVSVMVKTEMMASDKIQSLLRFRLLRSVRDSSPLFNSDS